MPLVLPTQSGGRTRAELRGVVASHGFNHYDDARIDFLLDQAVSDIHNEQDWPYKEGEQTGALPLVIEDLSQISRVQVHGTMIQIPVREAVWLEDRYGDLSVGGSDGSLQPQAIWVDAGKILRGWPPHGATVRARYLSTVCWSSGGERAGGDSDIPLVPARYEDLIILHAVGGCYGEDNQPEADRFQARYERRMVQMTVQLLSVNRDQPRVVRTGMNEY